MPDTPLEIERKFLLSAMPPIPDGAASWSIEQGYLPRGDGDPDHLEGRLRRAVGPDGATVLTHTVKEGTGLVRRERERTLTPEEFRRHWPRTAGRRLRKTRHRVEDGGMVWEIDRFHDLDLVLAEVELPDRDASPDPPDWLAPFIEREVTDEPAYANYALAVRARPDRAPPRGDGS